MLLSQMLFYVTGKKTSPTRDLLVFYIWCFSVAQSCLSLCNPTNCSMPGFPILHHFLELAQTHMHQVGDAIPPSYPLPSHSPPPFNLAEHQGSFQMSQFFTSCSQSIDTSTSASVLPMNIQGWFPLGWTGLSPLQSKGLSRVFSNTTVQKHQFFGTQPSLWSNSHNHTWLLEKNHNFDYADLFAKVYIWEHCNSGP